MRLYEFINCHLDDDSTMRVLYYTLRTELIRHDYSFRGVGEIQLDRNYTLEKESVNIQGLCNDSLDSVASLMSVRAIMLDSEYFDCCEDDHLLFHKANGFSWLLYYKILNEVPEDDDFDNLLEIMWHLYEDEPVDTELQSVFEEHTIEPPVLFDWDYYIGLARIEESLDNGVIPEQYFLEDSTLADYTVPSDVKYVGDTAFSYCHNLAILRFSNVEINFGVCPIVECGKLEHIVVPEGCVEAFCNKLPFYRDKITDEQIPCLEPQLSEDEHSEGDIATVEINDSDLSRIFDGEQTTYRHFWLLAILSLLEQSNDNVLSRNSILIRMIAISWKYVKDESLSFSMFDAIPGIVEDIHRTSFLKNDSSEREVEQHIKCFLSRYETGLLQLKNIPIGILSPWISYSTEEDVMTSSQHNDKVPYSLFSDRIVLREQWKQYLISHYSELADMTVESLMQQLNDSLEPENTPEMVEVVIEEEVQIPNMISVTEDVGGLLIKNGSRFCDLLDSSGKVLFHSIGKIKEYGGIYYKFDYAYSRLWIYLLKRDSDGKYSRKSTVVNASMNTPLFTAISPDGYIDEIDNIVLDETESSAMVHVGDKWYSKSGSLCPKFQIKDK